MSRSNGSDAAAVKRGGAVDLLPLALAYRAGGLSLIPCAHEGDEAKKPYIQWKRYQVAAADEATIRGWFKGGCKAVACIGGKVSGGNLSGGLLVIDFDEARFYDAWREQVGALADGLPLQRTGREGGGYQVWLRCLEPGGNDKLAWVPDEAEKTGRRCAIETRAEGGYALMPGSLHPSGRRYEVLQGDFANIPAVSQAVADALLAAARKLDEAPLTRQKMEARQSAAETSDKNRAESDGRVNVIDVYNERTTIEAELKAHGYVQEGERWKRPGGKSLSVYISEGRSFHHSSNDPLNDDYWHRPFDLFCELKHGGDCRAAVKAAAKLLGMKPSKEKPSKAKPRPLPVPAFDPHLLPDALRPWAVDIAARMQCPLDFVAVAATISLAGAVGRQVAIRPKQRDDWAVVPNLWGLLVGRPGVMKSPPMKEATRPLVRLEIQAKEEYERANREWAGKALVAEARRKVAQAEIVKALKAGNADAEEKARRAIDEEEKEPIRRRFVVNDPTVEKAQMILAENPNGITLLRDEAQGFLRSLDKPGREDARAFFLEAWNGDGRFAQDRVVRGTLDIPACCISMLATIQPGLLESYLRDAVRGGTGDDGLLPRFQLAVWPDLAPDWRNVDEWPDTKAKQCAFESIARLADLDPRTIGAEQGDDADGVPFLRFAGDAQARFNAWRGELETELRGGTLPAAVEAVLAKHRSLIPSLALLVHLADGGTGAVSLAALDKAIGWGRYLQRVRPVNTIFNLCR